MTFIKIAHPGKALSRRSTLVYNRCWPGKFFHTRHRTGFHHRVHTEWQFPLFGVHSIMMEKLAQSGGGEGSTPAPFHCIYYHIQSCGARSSWERADTLPLLLLYPYIYFVVLTISFYYIPPSLYCLEQILRGLNIDTSLNSTMAALYRWAFPHFLDLCPYGVHNSGRM